MNVTILSLMFLSLLSVAQLPAAPVVTLKTNQDVYNPGDYVEVAFFVSNTSAIQAPWLWFYVDGPDNRNVFQNNLAIGNGTDFHRAEQYPGTWQCGNLPEDALNGTYLVSVMWSHEWANTTFQVVSDHYPPVPEIPSAMLPLAFLCVLAASVWLLRKKTVNIPTLVK